MIPQRFSPLFLSSWWLHALFGKCFTSPEATDFPFPILLHLLDGMCMCMSRCLFCFVFLLFTVTKRFHFFWLPGFFFSSHYVPPVMRCNWFYRSQNLARKSWQLIGLCFFTPLWQNLGHGKVACQSGDWKYEFPWNYVCFFVAFREKTQRANVLQKHFKMSRSLSLIDVVSSSSTIHCDSIISPKLGGLFGKKLIKVSPTLGNCCEWKHLPKKPMALERW